jgi:hypothetical protein
MMLRGAFGLVAVLAGTRTTDATQPHPTETEAQFRHRAAAFKKLRRWPDKDNDWHRRCASALEWFNAHQELISDGRRTCAELRNRLGPPDSPSPGSLQSWMPKGKYGGGDAETERLDYEAAPQDDISSSRVRLTISCSNGKATAVAWALRIAH